MRIVYEILQSILKQVRLRLSKFIQNFQERFIFLESIDLQKKILPKEKKTFQQLILKQKTLMYSRSKHQSLNRTQNLLLSKIKIKTHIELSYGDQEKTADVETVNKHQKLSHMIWMDWCFELSDQVTIIQLELQEMVFWLLGDEVSLGNSDMGTLKTMKYQPLFKVSSESQCNLLLADGNIQYLSLVMDECSAGVMEKMANLGTGTIMIIFLQQRSSSFKTSKFK